MQEGGFQIYCLSGEQLQSRVYLKTNSVYLSVNFADLSALLISANLDSVAHIGVVHVVQKDDDLSVLLLGDETLHSGGH